ncbi:3-oxoadipate enol-lactonase [Maribius pontilimi]|uniref:3-oxoadipate enol-lactonase n=1 Tax=Palleronia pontilimi TaxID=1964209 RepID=A0A934IG02_9RHOB|nr:3-oxoadipate enol-lactonase [Palleronia pontilimi]MBJ3762432.1 3-oxoadipate enol-lactonase [Palleronia pontilimi]
MPIARLDGLHVNYEESGQPDGAPIVFVNSLGTDLRLWDAILPLLPAGLRIIRYDKRGHGLSDCPHMPYSMGALISDAERLLDHLGVRDCLLVGLSIGGMIAQGLAVKRPDQVRALVLSNTGAKIGTPEIWKTRIEDMKIGGIEVLADAVMQRWFPATFRASDEVVKWRHMLTRTPLHGYGGCSAAIAHSDFFASTATLRLPALGIAGSEDASTPPDLVRETMALIPGSDFQLIRGSGHLPCVDAPKDYAEILNGFIAKTGHV